MKKSFLLIVAGVLTVFSEANAQSPTFSWAKGITGTANVETGSSVIDALGNVYTTGYFRGTTDFDPGPGVYNLIPSGTSSAIFISKLDSSGNFLWAKKMDGIAGNGNGNAIALDALGNIYTAGSFSGNVDFDPGPGIFMLYCIAGPIPIDIFVSKLDPSGNFLWAKQMGGTGNDLANSIDVDDSSNVYTTGSFKAVADFDPGPAAYNLSCSGSYDIFVSKLDASGNFVWAKRMGSTSSIIIPEAGQSIAVDGNGDVYTTGLFYGTADFDPGAGVYNLITASSGIFISKISNSGNFIWAKAFVGTQCWGRSITAGADDNVYTTGIFSGTVDFDPGAGIYNLTGGVFVSKLDSSGNFVWAKSMGQWVQIYGERSISLDTSCNVYIAGEFSSDTIDIDPGVGVFNLTRRGLQDVFICKLDSSGNFVWAKSAGGTSFDDCTTINVSNSGGVYIAGYFSSTSITFDSDTLQNPDSTRVVFIAKLNDVLPTGFEVANNNSSISIFPNPASGIFTISLLNNNNKVEIIISDITGKIIYTTKVTHLDSYGGQKIEVNTKGFADGIYIVHIQSDNIEETKKLIITK